MKYDKLIEILETTHSDMQYQAFRSVDIALIIRNWLFGFYLVEYEQNGEDRAEYGARLIENISEDLRDRGIKGVSPTNLKKDREFYIEYKQIRQTVSVELAKHFKLSWSHYVNLLTIDDINERKFYEIESINNSWGVRELKRQIASSLYPRLSVSKNKAKVKQLSQKGQIIEKPENPTVGIVLCHRKNDALVELTLPENSNIFASKYKLYLPTKEELKRQLVKEIGMVKEEMALYGSQKTQTKNGQEK